MRYRLITLRSLVKRFLKQSDGGFVRERKGESYGDEGEQKREKKKLDPLVDVVRAARRATSILEN